MLLACSLLWFLTFFPGLQIPSCFGPNRGYWCRVVACHTPWLLQISSVVSSSLLWVSDVVFWPVSTKLLCTFWLQKFFAVFTAALHVSPSSECSSFPEADPWVLWLQLSTFAWCPVLVAEYFDLPLAKPVFQTSPCSFLRFLASCILLILTLDQQSFNAMLKTFEDSGTLTWTIV